MKKTFILLLFSLILYSVSASPQFVGEWVVKYYYFLETEIDLPDLDDYVDLMPNNPERIDRWEEYIWDSWRSESEERVENDTEIEFEEIEIIFHEEGTGYLDGELFVWEFYPPRNKPQEEITSGKIDLRLLDADFLPGDIFEFYFNTGVQPTNFTIIVMAINGDDPLLEMFTMIMIAEEK